MRNHSSAFEKKSLYEQFTKQAIGSEYFAELTGNNKSYRHVLRFMAHVMLFIAFVVLIKSGFRESFILGAAIYPFYFYFQGLLISGLMIHSHELTHHHVKIKWLNNLLGVISGGISFINFYSFQQAHRFHHRNIGNLDAPEAGAPVSLKGQERILHGDKLNETLGKLYRVSRALLFLLSWPLFIFYGDYNSWLLPFSLRGRIDRRSLICFATILFVNVAGLASFQFDYIFLYLLPVLFGGNRILAITFMHHAHEDSVFFNEENHNFFNTIMSTTDRDFGRIVNFFMMNNGYHIPHHMNPQIAYYDLKRASDYLRKTIPKDLPYNYYPKCRFYYELAHNSYEQRLDRDYEFYQLAFLSSPAQSRGVI
jgi:fatty acid desaturase